MASINLNQNPYYDDFNDSKNFERILFRPNFAVQARELNQIQSILAHQEQFSNRLKEGEKVSSGVIYYSKELDFVALKETVSVLSDATVKTLVGSYIATSGQTIVAKVIGYTIGTSSVPTVLFIKYVKGNSRVTSDEQQQFNQDDGLYEMISNVNSSSSFGTAGLATGITINLQGTDVIHTGYDAATKQGSGVFIDESVIYINGYSTHVPQQFLVLEKFGIVPTYSVGLELSESIVTSADDSSLLDNAIQSSNTSAPGADRLKRTFTLIREAIDYTSVSFLRLGEVKDGVFSLAEIPNYYSKEDYEATITGVTSGAITLKLDGGNTLINNKEYLNDSSTLSIIRGGLTTVDIDDYNVGVDVGNYIVTRGGIFGESVAGTSPNTFDIKDVYLHDWMGFCSTGAALHDKPFPTVHLLATPTAPSVADLGAIGTARVRAVTTEVDDINKPEFRIYLYDLNMTTGNLSDAVSLFFFVDPAATETLASERYAKICDIGSVSSSPVQHTPTQLNYPHQNSLLFKVTDFCASMTGGSNNDLVVSPALQSFNVIADSDEELTINVGTNKIKDFSNWSKYWLVYGRDVLTSKFEMISIDSDDVTENSGNTEVKIQKATRFLHNNNYMVVLPVERTQSTFSRSETADHTYPLNGYEVVNPTSGKITLNHTHIVKETIKIEMTQDFGSAVVVEDITSRYDIDDGQREDKILKAVISLKSGANKPDGSLKITYNHFGANSTGLQPIDTGSSYSNPSGAPRFTFEDGTTVRLTDCIDFRPIDPTPGTNSDMMFRPFPISGTVKMNLEKYVPRKYVVYLDSNGEIKYATGLAGKDLPTPEFKGLKLFEIVDPGDTTTIDDFEITPSDKLIGDKKPLANFADQQPHEPFEYKVGTFVEPFNDFEKSTVSKYSVVKNSDGMYPYYDQSILNLSVDSTYSTGLRLSGNSATLPSAGNEIYIENTLSDSNLQVRTDSISDLYGRIHFTPYNNPDVEIASKQKQLWEKFEEIGTADYVKSQNIDVRVYGLKPDSNIHSIKFGDTFIYHDGYDASAAVAFSNSVINMDSTISSSLTYIIAGRLTPDGTGYFPFTFQIAENAYLAKKRIKMEIVADDSKAVGYFYINSGNPSLQTSLEYNETSLFQKFTVESDIFVDSFSLDLEQKDDKRLPLFVDIRKVENGIVTNNALPYSCKAATASDFTSSTVVESTLEVPFENLIYLKKGEYALSISSPSLDYKIKTYSGTVGNNINQLYRGSSLIKNKIIAFKLHKAIFTISGVSPNANLKTHSGTLENKLLGTNPILVADNRGRHAVATEVPSTLSIETDYTGYKVGDVIQLTGVVGDSTVTFTHGGVSLPTVGTPVYETGASSLVGDAGDQTFKHGYMFAADGTTGYKVSMASGTLTGGAILRAYSNWGFTTVVTISQPQTIGNDSGSTNINGVLDTYINGIDLDVLSVTSVVSNGKDVIRLSVEPTTVAAKATWAFWGPERHMGGSSVYITEMNNRYDLIKYDGSIDQPVGTTLQILENAISGVTSNIVSKGHLNDAGDRQYISTATPKQVWFTFASTDTNVSPIVDTTNLSALLVASKPTSEYKSDRVQLDSMANKLAVYFDAKFPKDTTVEVTAYLDQSASSNRIIDVNGSVLTPRGEIKSGEFKLHEFVLEDIDFDCYQLQIEITPGASSDFPVIKNARAIAIDSRDRDFPQQTFTTIITSGAIVAAATVTSQIETNFSVEDATAFLIDTDASYVYSDDLVEVVKDATTNKITPINSTRKTGLSIKFTAGTAGSAGLKAFVICSGRKIYK